MLTPDDLNAIGKLLDEKLGSYPTKSELDAKLDKQKNEMISLVDEKLEKQKNEIIAQVDEKLKNQTQEILRGVGDGLNDAIIPMLENHEKRLEIVEQQTEHPSS
jgi:hypothetical protein